MSVLQTVQKNNNNNLHMDRQCKKQQTIYIWTDSAKKTTNNLHMDRQCKKQQTIYIWTDSAKNNNNLHMDRQCKKNNKQFTYGQTVQKKQQQQFTYGQTVQKNNKQFTYGQYIFTDCTEDNVQNTHTYTQYTQCTIKTHSIISDTYTVWAHLHYVQYLYIMWSIHSNNVRCNRL